MTTGKNTCKLNLYNLSKYEDLIKKYCKEDDIPKLKKVPISGNIIYFTRFPDNSEQEN